MANVFCPQCSNPVQNPPELAGEKVSCPICNGQFTLPPSPMTSNLGSQMQSNPKRANPERAAQFGQAPSRRSTSSLFPMLIGISFSVALIAIVLSAFGAIWLATASEKDAQDLSPDSIVLGEGAAWLGNEDEGSSFLDRNLQHGAADRSAVEAQFIKAHQGEDISEVVYHAPIHKYCISCSYRDSDGNQVSVLFNANSDSEKDSKVSLHQRKPGFELGSVHVVGSTYFVTYQLKVESGKRFGRDRIVASRPYSQVNDQIQFHGPANVRHVGTTTSRNPLTVPTD